MSMCDDLVVATFFKHLCHGVIEEYNFCICTFICNCCVYAIPGHLKTITINVKHDVKEYYVVFTLE